MPWYTYPYAAISYPYRARKKKSGKVLIVGIIAIIALFLLPSIDKLEVKLPWQGATAKTYLYEVKIHATCAGIIFKARLERPDIENVILKESSWGIGAGFGDMSSSMQTAACVNDWRGRLVVRCGGNEVASKDIVMCCDTSPLVKIKGEPGQEVCFDLEDISGSVISSECITLP